MPLFSAIRILALVIAIGLIAARDAYGQACMGVPAGPGQFALGGSIGFTDGATNYGGGVQANLDGPLAVGGSYTLTKIDGAEENFNTFGGTVALKLPVQGISACPASGLSWGRITGESSELGIRLSLTSTVIPVGLGIGRTFAAGNSMSLTLHAVPQFLYVRFTGKATDGSTSYQETETANEFGTVLGFALGLPNAFFGADVSLGLGLIVP